jgi:formate C-acetyltransferase
VRADLAHHVALWEHLESMFPIERERGVYAVDVHTPAGITAHKPGTSVRCTS